MKDVNQKINDILLAEESFRPADNVGNGQIDPISLSPEDFQAEPTPPVQPYPANLTPVEVEDLDEKEFVQSNPERDAGYSVDPNVDNLVNQSLDESAFVDGVKVSKSGGVEHLVATHNEESDEAASKKYEDALTSKEKGAKILRVNGNEFVIATTNGDVAQVVTQGGKHYARYSEMETVPLETGHVSSVVTNGFKLHESLDEDEQGLLESIMSRLAKEALYEANASDEMKGMLAAQGLNEDFTNNATTLFESAVIVASKKYMNILESATEKCIKEELDIYKANLQEQVDGYLQTVVNEWVEDNKLALEQGSRTQIAESFMEGLKYLLESHYVELPQGKTDLYESAIAKGEEILTQLNEEKAKNNALLEQVNSQHKATIIESAIKTLPLTKAEKVKQLAEEVEFTDARQFNTKLQFIVESVVGKAQPKLTSTLLEDKAPSNEPVAQVTLHEDVEAVLKHLNAYKQ